MPLSAISPIQVKILPGLQSGVVLLMTLVFLLILASMGVRMMQAVSLNEKITGHLHRQTQAFAAAQFALHWCENRVRQAQLFTLSVQSDAFYHHRPWQASDAWSDDRSFSLPAPAHSSHPVIAEQRCIIEKIVPTLASHRPSEVTLFRITARARVPPMQAMVQSYLKLKNKDVLLRRWQQLPVND